MAFFQIRRTRNPPRNRVIVLVSAKAVVDALRARMKELEPTLPGNTKLTVSATATFRSTASRRGPAHPIGRLKDAM